MPGASNWLQDRIIALDRSNDPILTQIDNAYLILGLESTDWQKLCSFKTAVDLEQILNPVEEWILRWLLKRFSAGYQPDSLSLEPKAWALLTILVARLPTLITARLLNSFKFPEILKTTLGWASHQTQTTGHDSSRSSRESSSSATVQDMMIVSSKSSTKRKRGQQESTDGDFNRFQKQKNVILYSKICLAVEQIQVCAQDTLDDSRKFAVEYLKVSVRASIAQAACILGSAMELARYRLTTDAGGSWLPDHCAEISLLMPIIWIWKSRSVALNDLDELASAKTFSKECLIPAIKLLSASQGVPVKNSQNQSITHEVEKLLFTHILSPIRQCFFRDKGTYKHADSTKFALVALIGELIGPVLQTLNPDLPNDDDYTYESLPLLLEMTVKFSPQRTPKQQTAENEWLQAFWHQLLQIIPLLASGSEVSTTHREFRIMLRQMLDVAVNNAVMLHDVALVDIIKRQSGVFALDKEDYIDWDLIGLCMKVSSTLFTTSSSVNKLKEDHERSEATKIFPKLLRVITEIGFKDPNVPSGTYDKLLQGIVLPSIAAFHLARDLPGFIEHWKQQLTVYHESRASWIGSGRCSQAATGIWEDDEVVHSISTKLDSALTTEQLIKSLKKFSQSLRKPSELSAESSNENIAHYHTDLVILDCLIDGVTSDGGLNALRETVQPICADLCTFIMSLDGRSDLHSWRRWRIMTTIRHRWSQLSVEVDEIVKNQGIIRTAHDALAKGLTARTAEPQNIHTCAEALFSLAFLLSFSSHSIHPDSKDLCRKSSLLAVTTVIQSLKEYPEKARNGLSGQAWSKWDGRRESIINSDLLILGCVTRIFLSPKCLNDLELGLLREFFDQLYWCALLESNENQEPWSMTMQQHATGYVKLWEGFLQCAYLEENAREAKCLQRLMVKNMLLRYDENNTVRYSWNSKVEFDVSAMVLMPFRLFERDRQTEIANFALSIVLSKKEELSHSNISLRCIELLGQCAAHPNKAMEIISSPNALWDLAAFLDNVSERKTAGSEKNAMIDVFKQITSKSIKHIIYGIKDSHDPRFIVSFLDHFSSACNAKDEANTALRFTSLHILWSLMGDLLDTRRDLVKRIGRLREEHFDQGLDSLDEMGRFDEKPVGVSGSTFGLPVFDFRLLLELFTFYPDLLDGRLPIARNGRVVEQIRSELLAPVALTNGKSPSGVLSLVPEPAPNCDASCDPSDAKSLDLETGQFLKGLSESLLTRSPSRNDSNAIRVRQLWLGYMEGSFSNLGLDDQTTAIVRIVRQEQRDLPHEASLRLLSRVLQRCHSTKNISPSLKLAISQTISTLCEQVVQAKDHAISILAMHCLNTILQQHAWAVNQWHIDSLLAAITCILSPSGPQIQDGPAGDVYRSLCRLLGTMLAVHRPKLGGRYHLVVVVLQGLLHCLFRPYATSAAPASHLERAPWLQKGDALLDPSHGTIYARLLTTICDPSVSAVTRSRKRQGHGLNDETKKARSMAGQHLQYVIVDFCHCQLRGHMEAEVRAALKPGLYAVFDAMTAETMRTVNAGLDSAGRAIFKMVYDDHRRFGKWDGA